MQTVHLTINGMSCGHCVARVSRTLASMAGVRADEVRIGAARVQLDPAIVSVDQITDALRGAGYEARDEGARA
jgi:copper chaperone